MNHLLQFKLTLFTLILLLTTFQLFAREPIKLPRLSGPITLDGVLDEAAWEAIEPLPLIMSQPTYKGEVVEPTEIRVAYDNDYIYLSGKLYVRDPGDIRANSYYRDRWSGDDTFAIIIDSFNDKQNAKWFFTNPLGTRVDMAVSDDAEGGFKGINSDWNSHWDVVTTQTDEGWFAEFRIPLSTLGFQDENGTVKMGLIVYRYMAVTNGRYIYPDIPPNWDLSFVKPSMAQEVILEGVYSKRPVYITPYGLAGISQAAELNEDGTAYNSPSETVAEIGGDIRFNVTNNLTFDGTINTDFAQVEADDQQVNLTRFSLFFPEKRQFFQERAGIFEFNFSGASRLFHSRRIGLVEGQPVRIIAGARLVGRINSWDVGILNMQTANDEVIVDDLNTAVPAENFGVARVRKSVFNPTSFIAGMFTSRVDKNGHYNLVYGLDGNINVFGDDYMVVKWAQSFDKTVIDSSRSNQFNAGRAFFSWERRRQIGFTYSAGISWAGRDYIPGVGFENREDFTQPGHSLNYQWFAKPGSWIRKHWVGNFSSTFIRNADNSTESSFIRTFYQIEGKTAEKFTLGLNNFYEDVREAFSIEDKVDIPVGQYWFYEIDINIQPPDGWLFRPQVEVEVGPFFDGAKYAFEADATWNISRFFELRGEYEVNFLRFSERDQNADLHLARIRIQAALNTHASLRAFFQYNSGGELASMNLRFRYNFREGNDLWIVYNEGFNTNLDQLTGPRLPRSDGRSLTLKYTYTFIK